MKRTPSSAVEGRIAHGYSTRVSGALRPEGWHHEGVIFGVGITGTNGKTTTTTWVAAALRALARSSGGGPVARATTVGFFLDDEEMVVEKTFAGFVEAMRACAERGGTHAAVELTSEALARG